MRYQLMGLALVGLCASARAEASPGVGDAIYGAKVEKGVTDLQARYGRLTGGSVDGDEGLVLEIEHAFSSRLSIAGLLETEAHIGDRRIVDAFAVEAIYTLGRIHALALDVAVYAEFKRANRGAPDAIELKGLFEHQAGSFDSRLNIIAKKPLRSAEPIELGYAASADWALVGDEVRLGVAVFGDLGSIHNFGGRQEHYAGPEIKFEIERVGRGEVEVELGYLHAFGAARDRANRQVRIVIGYDAHF